MIIIAFSLFSLLTAALIYFYIVQTTWVESTSYIKKDTKPARTLVVVYSRTGNTFSAAKEIAQYFNADMLQIKAPQYTTTIKGQMRAASDADSKVTTTAIEHDAVNLSRYDLIILCSPTWWFRPAPPLWSFVENHNFSGKSVFLMMTGNSRYKEKFTNEFAALVTSKNGHFLDMLFLRRGRIYWQKTPDEVNMELHVALEERKQLWNFLK